jgi:hypothetical protein
MVAFRRLSELSFDEQELSPEDQALLSEEQESPFGDLELLSEDQEPLSDEQKPSGETSILGLDKAGCSKQLEGNTLILLALVLFTV